MVFTYQDQEMLPEAENSRWALKARRDFYGQRWDGKALTYLLIKKFMFETHFLLLFLLYKSALMPWKLRLQ